MYINSLSLSLSLSLYYYYYYYYYYHHCRPLYDLKAQLRATSWALVGRAAGPLRLVGKP